jgi:branched-chain amino acid transport system substrate-binding protein
MTRALKAATAILAAVWFVAVVPAEAKDKVKVGFIGPLTGRVSVNGLGGRNSQRPESI